MMNKILIVAAAAFFLISCASDKMPEQDPDLYVKDSLKASEPINTASTNISTTDTAASQVPVSQMPVQTVSQATATTQPGMNPPHGQPGHRCDIAVGAPLNSPPAKPAAVTTTTSPVITQTTATQKATAKTVTAPGMNPPHGEAGHRCDIAVGAPLNSAPTKPAATTITTPVEPVMSPPAVEPLKKDS